MGDTFASTSRLSAKRRLVDEKTWVSPHHALIKQHNAGTSMYSLHAYILCVDDRKCLHAKHVKRACFIIHTNHVRLSSRIYLRVYHKDGSLASRSREHGDDSVMTLTGYHVYKVLQKTNCPLQDMRQLRNLVWPDTNDDRLKKRKMSTNTIQNVAPQSWVKHLAWHSSTVEKAPRCLLHPGSSWQSCPMTANDLTPSAQAPSMVMSYFLKSEHSGGR